MPTTRRRFSQEFKDGLCREVISTSNTINAAAKEFSLGAETLRNWVRKYRAENAPEAASGHGYWARCDLAFGS